MESAPSPAPSSPDLEGYNSALEEVNTTAVDSSGDDSDDSNVTIRSPPKGLSLIGVNPGPARSRAGSATLPPRDARGRFIRRPTSSSVGSAGADSESGSDPAVLVGSLEWDPLVSPLLSESIVSDQWSVTGTYDEMLLGTRPLSTLPEESASRVASAMAGNGGENDTEREDSLGNGGDGESDQVVDILADLEEAVMIVDEEMTPYIGKKLSKETLGMLVVKVEDLRRTLRRGHIFLVKQKTAEYTLELRENVAAAKQRLTDLMMYREEQLEAMESGSEAADQQRESGGGDGPPDKMLKQTKIRALTWADETVVLTNKVTEFRESPPGEEDALYACSEYLTIIIDAVEAHLRDGETVADQLRECGFYDTETVHLNAASAL